jgi:hypothetical protein
MHNHTGSGNGAVLMVRGLFLSIPLFGSSALSHAYSLGHAEYAALPALLALLEAIH